MKSKAKSGTHQTQLEARLDAYLATSRSVTGGVSAPGWRAALGNWPAYGVATAAALAGATSASAGIIYTPLNVSISAGSGLSNVKSSFSSGNIHVKHQTGQGYVMTSLGGPLAGQHGVAGTVFRYIQQKTYLGNRGGVKSNGTGDVLLHAAGGIRGASGIASALNKNAMISSGKTFSGGVLRERLFRNTNLSGSVPKTEFGGSIQKQRYSQATGGKFVPGQTFFAGIKLAAAIGTVIHNTFTYPGEQPATFQTHPVTAFDYGWLQLRVDDLDGIPVKLTLLGYAYNDVHGGSILAGDTGQSDSTTPEPSTAAMLLLAAGAAGVAAWKRQRKASA